MVVLPKGYLKFAGWSLLIGGTAGIIGQLLHLEDAPASIEEIPHFVQGAVNACMVDHSYFAGHSGHVLTSCRKAEAMGLDRLPAAVHRHDAGDFPQSVPNFCIPDHCFRDG